MTKSKWALWGIPLVLLVLVFGFFFFRDNIGVSKDSLEADARKSQHIAEGWLSAVDASDSAAAMLFYPEDGSRCTFSIYTKHSGLSFGYFFRGGGSLSAVDDGIARFTGEGLNDQLFLSMNKPQAARLEIQQGSGVRTVELDSEKPFALVLSQNVGVLTFYNVNNEVIEPISQIF